MLGHKPLTIIYESIQFAREPMDWGSAVKSGTVFGRSSRPYPSPLALGMLLVIPFVSHFTCSACSCVAGVDAVVPEREREREGEGEREREWGKHLCSQ